MSHPEVQPPCQALAQSVHDPQLRLRRNLEVTSDTPDIRALLACRTAVLQKLGHIDAAGLVQLKGKAACEVGGGLLQAAQACTPMGC